MSEAFHTIGCFNIHELIMSSDGRTITQSQCPVESWKGLIDESSVANYNQHFRVNTVDTGICN